MSRLKRQRKIMQARLDCWEAIKANKGKDEDGYVWPLELMDKIIDELKKELESCTDDLGIRPETEEYL